MEAPAVARGLALAAALALLAPGSARAELRLREPATTLASLRSGASTVAPVLLAPSLAALPDSEAQGRRSALWCAIPFGVGQFANGQPLKGSLFFAGETLAFATFAGTLAAFEVSKVEGELFEWGTFKDERAARRLETASIVSFWSGVGLAALGILDAFYSRPADEPGLAAGPAGLAYRF